MDDIGEHRLQKSAICVKQNTPCCQNKKLESALNRHTYIQSGSHSLKNFGS